MSDSKYGRKAGPAAASGTMKIGEEKTIGNVKITRTDRPYAYDLADAYNDALTQDKLERGLRWIVSQGNVKLVIDKEWTIMRTRLLKQAAEEDRKR